MKKQLKSHEILTALFAVFGALFFSLTTNAQTVTQHKTAEDAEKSAGKGIVFKIPETLTPMKDWSGFKGVLMLNLKQPAGAFVAYPNDGESLEDLMIRIKNSIAPMFVHEKDVKFEWQTAALPTHTGDKSAQMNVYKNGNQAVQIAFYQRENNNLPLVYGYFAMKSDQNNSKGVWLDDAGKGVKDFDKLWKSFVKD